MLFFLVACQNSYGQNYRKSVFFENIYIGDNIETCLAKGTVQYNPDYNNETIIKNNISMIELANNNIDIKNVGFSILNQPLKFFGRISKEAEADLHLLAENLSLKGLLIACGQATLLKENPVNSGSITLKADIVGRLNKIKPTAQADLNNIEIKNLYSFRSCYKSCLSCYFTSYYYFLLI
jgi:hypothetical protein